MGVQLRDAKITVKLDIEEAKREADTLEKKTERQREADKEQDWKKRRRREEDQREDRKVGGRRGGGFGAGMVVATAGRAKIAAATAKFKAGLKMAAKAAAVIAAPVGIAKLAEKKGPGFAGFAEGLGKDPSSTEWMKDLSMYATKFFSWFTSKSALKSILELHAANVLLGGYPMMADISEEYRIERQISIEMKRFNAARERMQKVAYGRAFGWWTYRSTTGNLFR